jgi:transcriptional regulator GlxA family with amidase domain
MTDRELLELAAKAAGLVWDEDLEVWLNAESYQWNPLTDDGDALRLAVKLQLTIDLFLGQIKKDNVIICYIHGIGHPQPSLEDTRRAIVRAAAEIGKQKE